MTQSSDEGRKLRRRRRRGDEERSSKEISQKKRRHSHERRVHEDDRHRRRDRKRGGHRDRERRRHSRSRSYSDGEEVNKDRSRNRKRSHKHSSKRSSSRRDETSHDSRKHKRTQKSSKRNRSRSRSESRGVSVKTNVKLVPLGPISQTPPMNLIHPKNDYFSFHNHLRLFLYRNENQTFFEDLSSDESHAAFQRFCSRYNAGGVLEQAYYEKELPEDAMAQCKRTKHTWNFRTSAAEEKSLDVIKSGVKKQTQYSQGDSKVSPTVCLPVAQSSTNDRQSNNQRIGQARRATIPPRNIDADSRAVEDATFTSNAAKIEKGAGFVRSIETQSDKTQSKEAMLASFGLSGLIKPGQKITIAPRKG